jgi:fibro-slime domain-containing protein
VDLPYAGRVISAFLRGGSAGARPVLLGSARAALCGLGLAALFAPGCGARTELLPGQEPCGRADTTRVCYDRCGQGEQVCEAGLWQECVVAPTKRDCHNDCGQGEEVCVEGAWGTCVVPATRFACVDACGTGSKICRDGVMGVCDVPPVTTPCSDVCGIGSTTCSKGVQGDCVVPEQVMTCSSVCGEGQQICRNGKRGPCSAPQPKPPTLKSTVRDFSELNTPVVKKHPDFELPLSGNLNEKGLVLPLLGPDDKPVYANLPGSVTTTGQANFDQWYRDTPGINQSTQIELQLTKSPDDPGLFVYADESFFPIDGMLWGNGNRQHNFHFTLETSFQFHYIGGEVFRFRGDDDLWIFVNRHLAIDLGGIHASESGEVQLDQVAAQFGMSKGNTYPLHLFFAERHTEESHFSVETSIADPGTCP